MSPERGFLGAVILAVLANDIPAQRSVTFVTGQCFSAFRITPILVENLLLSLAGSVLALRVGYAVTAALRL